MRDGLARAQGAVGNFNRVPNPSAYGAVPGTPGTLPTGWTKFFGTAGLSQQVVGWWYEAGVAGLLIRIFGTASSSAENGVYWMANTPAAAVTGQVVTAKVLVKKVFGNLPAEINAKQYLIGRNAGLSALDLSQTLFTIGAGPIRDCKVQTTLSLVTASTVWVDSSFAFTVNSGSVVDFTLALARPKLELGAVAT